MYILLLKSFRISIHAPARGATGLFLHSTWRSGFQSTLPRGERRKSDIVSGAVYAISIHAPARGATGDAVRKQIQATISIHAPARGATDFVCICYGCNTNFNPRSREGSDRQPSEHWRFRQAFQSTLPRGERPTSIRRS